MVRFVRHGPTLRLFKGADTQLVWAAAVGAVDYKIRRSEAADFMT
jgi:hypothetical protein